MKFEIASDDLGIWDVSDVQDLYSSLKSSAKSYNVVLQYDGEDGFNYAFTAVGDGDDLLALYDNAIRWYTKMSAEDAASESAENGGITMAAKKTAAGDFDWSLESYDDPDYGEIKEWTYDTGKDEFTIQSYVDEDGIEHFDATSSVNGLLNENFGVFDSFEEAENACYNAADLDDENEADDPFATEASAKKASDGWTGYLTVKDPESILDSKVYDNGDTAKILYTEESDEVELFVINSEGDVIFRDNGNKSEIDQLKNEWDERETDMTTNANKQASVKQAHDVSNLDAAISALSDQLALDPDNELADMLADLVEYRNDEADETVEDEIEEHGGNVPITEDESDF
jgi:hypothetical protein